MGQCPPLVVYNSHLLRIFALLPQLLPPKFKEQWGRGQYTSTAAQPSHSPMHPNAPIHGPRSHNHPARNNILNELYAQEGSCGVVAIAVDYVHVTTDVDGDQDRAKDETSREPRPDGYAAVIGPPEPEQGDRQQRRSHDARPQSEFRLNRGALYVLGLVAGLGEKDGGEQSDEGGIGGDGAEAGPHEANRELVSGLEDVVKAGEKGE